MYFKSDFQVLKKAILNNSETHFLQKQIKSTIFQNRNKLQSYIAYGMRGQGFALSPQTPQTIGAVLPRTPRKFFWFYSTTFHKAKKTSLNFKL